MYLQRIIRLDRDPFVYRRVLQARDAIKSAYNYCAIDVVRSRT